MDPATAIGLASAIITFIDFSKDLIHNAAEIYKSPEGTLGANAHLGESIRRLRLDQDRLDILVNLGNIFRENHSSIIRKLDQLKEEYQDLSSIPNQLDDLRRDLLRQIEAGQNTPTKDRTEPTVSRQGDSELKALRENSLREVETAPVSKSRQECLRREFIEIRRNTGHQFVRWLREGENILHISGKAGAGKSTLMKFISRHERTLKELRTWAGSKTLVTADYYFWNSGSKLQMSLQGLYRNILFQVLSHCPEMIETIFPSQWRLLRKYPGDMHVERAQGFSKAHFEEAFQRLMRRGTHDHHRFCFFIDGLDEYEGNLLEHAKLARTLKIWTQGGDVKICASSRPYDEFLRALSDEGNPTIHLHQMNKFDIFTYCIDRLRKDSPSKMEDESYIDLIMEITQNSRGVFLWAHLVLETLLIGIHHGDPYPALRQKLREMPPELNQLYDKMRAPIEASKVDMIRSNTMLLLVACNPLRQDVPAMAFSWLDDLEEPNFRPVTDRRRYSPEELADRFDQVKRQINRITRGFLELSEVWVDSMGPKYGTDPPARSTVLFTHRTAKDYILASEKKLLEMANSSHTYTKNIAKRFVAKEKSGKVFAPYGKLILGHYMTRPRRILDQSSYTEDLKDLERLSLGIDIWLLAEVVATAINFTTCQLLTIDGSAFDTFRGLNMSILNGEKLPKQNYLEMDHQGQLGQHEYSFLHWAAAQGLTSCVFEILQHDAALLHSQDNTLNLVVTAVGFEKFDTALKLLRHDYPLDKFCVELNSLGRPTQCWPAWIIISSFVLSGRLLTYNLIVANIDKTLTLILGHMRDEALRQGDDYFLCAVRYRTESQDDVDWARFNFTELISAPELAGERYTLGRFLVPRNRKFAIPCAVQDIIHKVQYKPLITAQDLDFLRPIDTPNPHWYIQGVYWKGQWGSTSDGYYRMY
ncbi:hypothetical protein F5Y15DRAFT_419316 [Xylariaceae sp. FL0016]|nr:hypothetical protein F5Y15DRAFT_419316 [Xylariaceae sp. FL0016]